MKHLPTALYPCKHCYEEYTWPADDLWWSEVEKDWVCDCCWDCDRKDEYGEWIENEPKGVNLSVEMAAQEKAREPTKKKGLFIIMDPNHGEQP